MRIHYDEKLIEAAVFVCSSGRTREIPGLQIRRFQREREEIYSIRDPDARNTAFFNLHLAWFREWNLERFLLAILREFHLFESQLHSVVFRSVSSPRDEGAELFVRDDARNAVIAFQPSRFAEEPALAALLRHECTCLQDMIEPRFGYSPELSLLERSPAHQRLTRERYRLLWKITVDGRLAARKQVPLRPREWHAAEFSRAYAFWDRETQDQVFHSLWHDPAPRHARLLELAADPRGLAQSCAPAPGALCSLCGFPTFDWSPPFNADDPVAALILQQFPGWTPAQGVCARCGEIYAALQKQNQRVAA